MTPNFITNCLYFYTGIMLYVYPLFINLHGTWDSSPDINLILDHSLNIPSNILNLKSCRI